MTFESAWYLQAGALLAALGALASWRHHRRRRSLGAFLGGRTAVQRLSPSDLYRVPLERLFLLTIATLAAAGAAAGPAWPSAPSPVTPSVVIAIDVSASMQAVDVEPTRLSQAVETARTLVDALQGDEVGLLLFSGTAYPLAPPTPELEVVRHFLGGVTPTIASAHDPGTLLSDAIREAGALWTEAAPGEARSIVLISDGDTGEPDDAIQVEARAVAARGIRVHTISVGTAEGSGMVMPDAPYQLGAPVLDASGAVGVSHARPELLGRIARLGGGRFVEAGDAGAVDGLAAALGPSETTGPWWTGYDPAGLLIVAALVGLLLEGLFDVRLPARSVSLRVRRPA